MIRAKSEILLQKMEAAMEKFRETGDLRILDLVHYYVAKIKEVEEYDV